MDIPVKLGRARGLPAQGDTTAHHSVKSSLSPTSWSPGLVLGQESSAMHNNFLTRISASPALQKSQPIIPIPSPGLEMPPFQLGPIPFPINDLRPETLAA